MFVNSLDLWAATTVIMLQQQWLCVCLLLVCGSFECFVLEQAAKLSLSAPFQRSFLAKYSLATLKFESKY